MNSSPFSPQTEPCFYVHNCFGSLFRGILDWFGNSYYQRFTYRIIGTYDKSVEFFKKKQQLGHEVNAPILPSITLDPGLDFSPEERAGRFMWQYPNLSPGLGFKLFPSIDLKEQEVTITPVFTRYQGTFEVIFWLSSVYELIDFRTSFLQFVGGFGRWVRPEFFWSTIILPDVTVNTKTNENKEIDWGNTDATLIQIDTINKRKRAIPFNLDAIWKLDSFNDNSTKYGGDNIAEYKLSATFTYEVNIPTYVVLNKAFLKDLFLQFNLGTIVTRYPLCTSMKLLDTISKLDSTVYKLKNDSLQFYRINPDSKKMATEIIGFDSNTFHYPKKDDFIAWNSIYSGKLKYITTTTKNSDIDKGDIIIIDSYNENYLSFIRRSSCVLCKNSEMNSDLLDKCIILKKGMISDFTSEDLQILKNQINKDVTVDIPNLMIYSGILPTEKDDSSNIGTEQVQKIKDMDPELYQEALKELECKFKLPENTFFEWFSEINQRGITPFTDGIQTVFNIKYVIYTELSKVSVLVNDIRQTYEVDYTFSENGENIIFIEAPAKGSKITIGGELLPIRSTNLILVYEFTEQDDLREHDDYISLDFPADFKKIYEVFPVSYFGRLEYEKDYELDFINKKIILKIKPKYGEVVEFFYFEID